MQRNSEEQMAAYQYEMNALSNNDTWELVVLPPGCISTKSKWVFKLKVDGHFHARLVTKGFTQIPGIFYDENLLPCCTLWVITTTASVGRASELGNSTNECEISILKSCAIQGDLYGATTRFYRCQIREQVLPIQKAIYDLK